MPRTIQCMNKESFFSFFLERLPCCTICPGRVARSFERLLKNAPIAAHCMSKFIAYKTQKATKYSKDAMGYKICQLAALSFLLLRHTEKYNVFRVFFFLPEALCIAFAGSIWQPCAETSPAAGGRKKRSNREFSGGKERRRERGRSNICLLILIPPGNNG